MDPQSAILSGESGDNLNDSFSYDHPRLVLEESDREPDILHTTATRPAVNIQPENITDNQSENAPFSIVQGRNKVVFVQDNTTGMYKCHQCSYETQYRSSMKSHYAVHSNARPYACGLCEYEAKRLCDLKKHKHLKHGFSFKSMRKNNWRHNQDGGEGTATGDTETNNDGECVVGQSSPSKISLTRSGIPIEIVEDEEEEDDEICFSDEFDFSNSTYTGLNSFNDATNISETSENSSHRKSDGDIVPPIKSEPIDTDDTFFKHYYGNNDDSAETTARSVEPRIETNSPKTKRPRLDARETKPRQNVQRNDTPPRRQMNPINSAHSSPAVPTLQTLNSPNQRSVQQPDTSSASTESPAKSWKCVHCNILFFDSALFFMHKGLHDHDDPWKCNLCNQKYYDVYGFTSHFVNGHANSS